MIQSCASSFVSIVFPEPKLAATGLLDNAGLYCEVKHSRIQLPASLCPGLYSSERLKKRIFYEIKLFVLQPKAKNS